MLKFDFSKEAEQERFNALSEEDRQEIIEASHEEANSVKKMLDSNKFNPAELSEIPVEFHKEIALKLFEADWGGAVATNLEKFSGLDHKETALKLIEEGREDMVARNLEKFSGLDHEVALKLIEAGKGDTVAYHLEKFSGLDHEVALKLIEAGKGDTVARKLKKFSGLDHKEIALKLIEKGGGWVVAENLEKFSGLDHEVALKLIEVNNGEAVARKLEKFSGLDHKEVVLKFIEVGRGDMVARYFENFSGLDHEVALKLIDAGFGNTVVEYIEKFSGLDHKETALKLIDAGKGSLVAYYLKNFPDLDHKEIALKLIEKGYGNAVTEHLDKFSGLDREVALKLIEEGGRYAVVHHLEKFSGLDREVVLKLIEAGEGDMVTQHLEKFSGLDPLIIKEYVEKNNLTITEAIYCICKDDAREEIENKEENEDIFLRLYEKLKNNHPDWKDQENIIAPFEAGGQVFGYERMFKYLGRKGLSRHDGLHNFGQIKRAYEASGLKAAEFYNKILLQVRNDDSSYYEGTAHHHLNNLVNGVNYDVSETELKAQEYKDINKLQELMNELGDLKNIFSSWKNLKKYHELCELLGQAEVLDRLKDLKNQGKDELYRYVETLAFHPNISMPKVFEFFENPEEFLEIADSHTPTQVHDRKKPSNYIHIPNLDLSAQELRDALVEGSYDKLQAFTPMEIFYEVNKGAGKISLREDLARQIGVRDIELRKKLGIGETEDLKSDPKLFSRLNKIFKERGLDFKGYLNGEIELTPEFLSELGQFQTPITKDQYRVKINKKSDPDAVVAGNDTACCMPFGSGKNNVYTFNPICALFTVQKKNADGSYRTVAQSVLTLDKDVGKNISELVGQLDSTEQKMHEIIDEEVLKDAPSIITCDNVELAENYKNQPNAGQVLEKIYRDFFQEYIRKHGQAQGLNSDFLIIGQGYSDSLKHLPTVDNRYAPEAPVGYSDNLHPQAFYLDLKKQESNRFILDRNIKIEKETEREEESEQLPQNIAPLTFRDSLEVAYIEGKAYHDNESLIQYLHNMENALIAKDVNNQAKGRPNMSFKYKSQDGKIQGYILAYEGRLSDDKDGVAENENIIYVSDLASNSALSANKQAKEETGTTIGQQLLNGFILEYKKNYIDKNNLLPIYAQFREKTSYKIITKQLDKIAKDIGVSFDVKEIGQYQEGEDKMHELIIRVMK